MEDDTFPTGIQVRQITIPRPQWSEVEGPMETWSVSAPSRVEGLRHKILCGTWANAQELVDGIIERGIDDVLANDCKYGPGPAVVGP